MNNELIMKMMEHDQGHPSLIQHFLKVYEFASLIGEKEILDEGTLHILKTTAILHDIGILPAKAKYGSSNGLYQEELGPKEAEDMLKELGYSKEAIDRVSYLVGHHHTYDHIEGMDYQILVEADFLVNLYEGNRPAEAIKEARKNIFKTKTGLWILDTMFKEI